ncbi:aromatic amino acid ammonia-lyase [Streptomyces acidiscabies]|uniref:Aromatic amino acid lyase n=3 Tax=Streptomyces acidiscabies TaxID=42234 RepID=A0AAP6BEB7_9ACTN|nr:aromatic amino acid ammonia-lyase [Streptomyces acidiscabies]MBZ3913398.1 aromatic amino acid lyase [Streptomyces acidiscabies]MDX2963177.1 aromatic amino acid lyase [Streptomyces acidiscabies]MDX3024372.1 aromatic amino acid lyase [Streptomyces acidiscabies]MDX3795230.1 aromatic amino acid lyase [Streptomyces acidiscabies]GAQ53298.1 histidine ammonia-lyase [Streptomyces acidiscabies]
MSSRILDTANGVVVLDGTALGVPDVVRLADGTARPVPGTDAMRRTADVWDAARQIAATGRVYGRSTGVGANRGEDVPTEEAAAHGLRLLRSHAGAIGEELPARQVRAMLAVRANQILAGGAGLRPDVVTALCEALESGAYPVVNEFGSVGTGDLAALAQVGLALAGEHPWRGDGAPEPQPLDNNDALALISSNALTLGQAALAVAELRGLLEATQVVAALSLLAVDGSHEAYAAPVHAARPHRGSVEVARRMRELIGAEDRPVPPLGRIQDPYGFRCLPQIHGPAHEAADALEAVLGIEINAAAENPLICPEDQTAYHHGGFYQAQLALALDHFRLSLVQVARLSTARLSTLNEPAYTRLRPFLAEDRPGSSGVMILEYAAGAALGDLRAFCAPASLGHAVLSRGVEEQASFASLAARQALRAGEAYRLVVGCELVAAVRALRLRDLRPEADLPVARALALAEKVLDAEHADRPLTDDVGAAARLLGRFTEIWRTGEASSGA